MKNFFPFAFTVLCISLVFSSCDIKESTFGKDTSLKGVFIMNQGDDIIDASVTHYHADTLTNSLFRSVNNQSLAGEMISASFGSIKGYLLLKNGNEKYIQKVSLVDFKAEDNFSTLANTTDLASVSDTFVYVTTSGSGESIVGSVHKLDAVSLSVLNSIKVGVNPTKIAYDKGKLVYVANTDDAENGIMVIDMVRNETIDTIKIEGIENTKEELDGKITTTEEVKALVNPVDMLIDGYNNLWVLCAGSGETTKVGAGLARISYVNHDVTIFSFDDYSKAKGRNCIARSIGGATIYFINDDGTHSIGFNDDEFADATKTFKDDYETVVYDAISVSSNNGQFYCVKPGEDKIVLFDSYGFKVEDEEITVGANPGKCLFR